MLIGGGMLTFLVLFSGVSAIDSSLNFNFFRQQPIFRKDAAEVCRMCYGQFDCLTLEKTRCEYNAETAAILYDKDTQRPQKAPSITQIDIMFNDLMFEELKKYEECVPIISSYTDCTRENICSGCRMCDCTLEGKWNCSIVQQCSRDQGGINHRVLVFVMEKLKSDRKPNRAKRELYYQKRTSKTDQVGELLKWFYDDTAPKQEHKFKFLHDKEPGAKFKRESNPTNIPLDDVLNVIGLDTNDSSTDDAVIPSHVDNNDSSKDIDDFLQMLSYEEGNETRFSALDDATKLIVNFGDDNNVTDNLNTTGTNEQLNKQVLMENDFNLMDSLGFINLINVMKRDVKQVNESTGNVTAESNKLSRNFEVEPVTNINTILYVDNKTIEGNSIKNERNITHAENSFQNDILDAITMLIENKHRETEQLLNIKESLIRFMKNYNFNSTVHYESKFDKDRLNPMFETEMKLNNYDGFRRSYPNNNPNLVEKYYNKLKNDVNEVVRDILGIRKYQKSKYLSNELKLMLKAITYFLKKSKNSPKEKNRNSAFSGKINILRRNFNPTIIDTTLNPISTAVIKMLELIDKDMPTSNALSPLSPRTKKILKRVITRNYVDDFKFSKNDAHNNLTSYLKNIGLKWQELTGKIVNCAAADRQHIMKLLYLTLSKDMIQLENALTLTSLFYSRRVSIFEENEHKAIINRINEDLIRIDNIVRRYKQENKVKKVKKTKQKQSLFKRIKGLWKSSKNDLINVIHKRSRPSIIKEMERKKMEDQQRRAFLDVIQKWQDNLDIMSSRNKRSIREYTMLKNRMKNIIPHYLRGKLHPALTAKGTGARKTIGSYKMRPRNTIHPTLPAAKKLVTTIKPKAGKPNKVKQNH